MSKMSILLETMSRIASLLMNRYRKSEEEKVGGRGTPKPIHGSKPTVLAGNVGDVVFVSLVNLTVQVHLPTVATST